MISSSEAFERFSRWKNLKTSLIVTVIVGGKTEEVLTGWRIFAADPDASQVGIFNPEIMHSFSALDVEGATFSIELARLVVTRNESDWLIFEEVN